MATNEVTVGPLDEVQLAWPWGDDAAFRIECFDDEAETQPTDYSGGWTFKAELRKKYSYTTSWLFGVDSTDAATGVFILTAPTDDDLPTTGEWDLRRTLAGEEHTIVGGQAVLDTTVTRFA